MGKNKKLARDNLFKAQTKQKEYYGNKNLRIFCRANGISKSTTYSRKVH
jgi:hypothetical protein